MCGSILHDCVSSLWKNSTLKRFLCSIIFWKMKLSGSNIKNFPTFSYILRNGNPEKNSLYFREFQGQAQKIKKPPLKKVLIFWEMELSSFNIKIFFIFSQKKVFLIFQEMETPKKILYILGNGTLLYFSKRKP